MKFNQLKHQKGVTLIELMITLAIFGIVMATIFSINLFGLRTFSLSRISADNQFEVRMPTDFIAKHIRYADRIKILSAVPGTPTAGSHQIYLQSGQLVYKEYGSPAQIIGTNNVGDYTFTIAKKAGTSNVVTFTIGKSGTTKFDLTTDVIGLNLDVTGITGDNSGIYVEFFSSNADAVTPVTISTLPTPLTKFVQVNQIVSLPLRVTANMSNGTTRQVAARWSPSHIDTSSTGTYSSTGRVVGFNGTVTYTVVVGNYSITNINPVALTINKGQTFTMPPTVVAEYTDGTDTFEQDVAVTWSSTITSDVPGVYISEGTVVDYADIVELTVTVNDVTISSISNISETVNQGVTYTLPNEVPATMSDGSVQSFPVTWFPASIGTMTAGVYSSTGTVSSYGNISLTLTVIQSRIPTPTASIITGGNNGVIRVNGLIGATATLRKSNGQSLGSGIIGASGEVEISGINTSTLHNVVLTKTGWLDSLPKVF